MSRAISKRPDVIRLHGRRAPAALVLAFVLSGAAARADPPAVPEPSGYRLDDYRAPTPATVAGGQTIDTAEAETLWRQGQAVFVDVLPAPRRPPGLRPEAVWKPLPRRDIPRSLWLPDVGRGALNPALDAYFRNSLAGAAQGDKDRPLVFYCLAECWMSWNAAKRAAALGYRRVYWYRDGTDGWERARLPLAEATPAPGLP